MDVNHSFFCIDKKMAAAQTLSIMKKICFYIIAFLLFGCGTLETHIENIDDYSRKEMILPSNALFRSGQSGIRMHPEVFNRNYQKKTLILNGYYTVETGPIAVFSNVPPPGRSGIYNSSVGGRYDFFKEDVFLYRFEIVTDSIINIHANDSATGISRSFIRVLNEDNSVKMEIEPNMPNSEVYFAVNDDDIGSLVVKQYRSRSANQSEDSRWRYHTGFIIEINGNEYGILAFYPNPGFYQNNLFNEIMNEQKEDKIILYIFMAYKRLFQEEDIFIRR